MTEKTNSYDFEGATCAVPLVHDEKIVMGHGSGGRMSLDLIRNAFYPSFKNDILGAGDDAGVFDVAQGRMAMSTDGHVVAPLFFPGGDIGSLAVCGTVNDLAVMGAVPRYITVGFVLEEGLPMQTLAKVIDSMKRVAAEAGVQVVAGDTKVVQKGNADGLYITVAGVGMIPAGVHISGNNAQVGDAVIVSGTIGDHGIAVLAARGDLGVEVDLKSDVAPLNGMIAEMMQASNQIHVMRDPTRGGVATTLNEIAGQSGVTIELDQEALPYHPAVQGACEILGFDGLNIANEGKILTFVAQEDAEKVLAAMRAHEYGKDATIIGRVTEKNEKGGRVVLKTLLGTHRIVEMLRGEMLPRIC